MPEPSYGWSEDFIGANLGGPEVNRYPSGSDIGWGHEIQDGIESSNVDACLYWGLTIFTSAVKRIGVTNLNRIDELSI